MNKPQTETQSVGPSKGAGHTPRNPQNTDKSNGNPPNLNKTPLESRKINTEVKDKSHNFDERIFKLETTIKELRERKKYTLTDDAEWFKISTEEKAEGKKIAVFKPRAFGDVVTLASLKQERIRKEKERIAKLTQEILGKILSATNAIKAKELTKAEELFAAIGRLVNEVPDKSVRVKYVELRSALEALRENVREEEEARRLAEQKRQEEERKRREEEERKRKEEQAKREAEERERKRKEEKARIERERKYQEELRRKEEAAQQERDRLIAINSERKEDAEEILDYLRANGVRHFYHFTDRRNLTSIKKNGGLLSWDYCVKHGITIPNAGGDDLSRSLDRRHGLQDYVRVSFCNDHPMAYHVRKRGGDLVLLRISIEVAAFSATLFSDRNATDNYHSKGPYLEDLKEIDIAATQMSYLKNTDPNFGPHQAEVMIKTFIPIEYVLNIDNPPTMF